MAALEQHGAAPRRVTVISPPNARKHGRSLHHVELAGGGVLKARVLESADVARRLFALRQRADAAFAPMIAAYGPVLLEAWIEGVMLGARESEAYAAEAGTVLARLHATPVAVAEAMPPLDHREIGARASTELAVLARAGALSHAHAVALAAELDRRAPAVGRPVLVHRDYCAENMLVDADGRLRVIDNEWLAIAPEGLDLGRTFARWPMSPPAWRRFLAAYRSAGRDPGPLGFWGIAAAAMGACFRLGKDPALLAVPIAALQRLADDPTLMDAAR